MRKLQVFSETRNRPMDSERINQISARIDDLRARTDALRGYL
jgi:hypothetical protein